MATLDLGDLKVGLRLDEEGLAASQRSAVSSFQGFAHQITTIAAGIGLERLLTQGISSIVGSIKSAVQEMDKIGDTADRIGIAVTELSKLKFAAEQNDITFEQLTTSLTRFQRAMAETAGGATTPAARTFEALNISVQTASGGLKSTTQVLTELATKFATFNDGAAKTALAINLFGRSGAALVPLLNQGADGINELMREAESLGIVMSTSTKNAVDEFDKTLKKLGATKDAIFMKVVENLLPALQKLADQFLSTAKSGDTLQQIANTISSAIQGMGTIAATVVHIFQRLTAEALALANVFSVAFGKGSAADFSAALQRFRDEAAQTVTSAAELKAGINEVTQAVAVVAPEGVEGAIKGKIEAPIVQSTERIKESLRKLNDEARYALDQLLARDTTPGVEKLAALDAALKQGTISWRQYGEAVRKVEKDQKDNLTDLASSTASTLTAIFKNNKAAGIASAIINTAVGVTKALSSYPPPVSFAMAALQLAAGLAQIATIRSTNEGGGGAPAAPPSTGAATAAAAAAEAVIAPNQQTLTVQGLSPDAIMSGASVRNLAERLLQYQRDGGMVVLA